MALKPIKQYAGAVLELTSFVSHSSGIAVFSCQMSILLETVFLRFVLVLVVFGRWVNWSLFHLTWLKSKVPSRYHLFFFFFQVKLHTSNLPFKNFNHLMCTIQWLFSTFALLGSHDHYLVSLPIKRCPHFIYFLMKPICPWGKFYMAPKVMWWLPGT